MQSIIWGALAACAALAHGAAAQTAGDTLRLAEAVALAHESDPALAAARLAADAALARASQAGSLPDPQLTFGLQNRPLSGFGTDDMMTMNTIGVTQMLPWPGGSGQPATCRALSDWDIQLHATRCFARAPTPATVPIPHP